VEFLQELTEIAKDMDSIQDDLNIDMLQPLIDLGYLTLIQCKPENQHRKTFLEIAVKQFRKDYETYQLHTKRFTFQPFEQEHYHHYKTNLNEIETAFIQKVVSFEGGFEVTELPTFGTVTLASRIIHYRLEMFGLYGKSSHHGIDAPFTDESLKNLHLLKGFLEWKTIDDIVVLNWLGDLNALIDQVFEGLNKDKNRHKKVIFVFEDGTFDTSRFGIDAEDTTEEILCHYEFMARLFQIYLWVNGLYHGAIDGVIKNNTSKQAQRKARREARQRNRRNERNEDNETDEIEAETEKNEAFSTENAILELVYYLNQSKDIERPNNKPFEVDYFYGKWENTTTYRINIINILERTKALQIDDNSESITEIIDKNDGETNNEKDKISTQLFNENGRFSDLVKTNLALRKNNFLSGTRRKIYYGIQLFKKVFRRIVGVFKKIGDFFKTVFNIVKRIAILIYQEVKEGIKVFIHGFSFLVGKRRIATRKIATTENLSETERTNLPESIVTKFDLDCDVKQFIHQNISEKEIDNHNEKCRNQINSLAISLVVTAIVLRWILLLTTSTVTFPAILLMVGKTLRQVKWQKLKQAF
jgi:hypothetical protein